MFQFPESLSAQGFLNRYWQKAPLFMPAASSGDLPTLSADELAWLATLDDVESRLVFTEREGNRTRYRVEHGPFDHDALGGLPAEDWTLLVQDVEKHLPELRRYLREASFVPDWRIDDLMVSFAAPGGSVGPHRDNYDVFLCQGAGRREWRIAPRDAKLRAIESGGLSLLEPFVDERPFEARPGDVLYLPPEIAHWGIATDACITYSIGMRAPQASEFADSLHFDENGDRFYADPDLAVMEAEPGLISRQAIERARSCLAASPSDHDLARRFGRAVTGVKAWITPETPAVAEADELLASWTDGSSVRVHGMARLAFFDDQHTSIVFANGVSKTASPLQLELFRRICASRQLRPPDIHAAEKDAEANELLRWLVSKGAFDLDSDQDAAREG